jgi:hypothetical protein
MSYLNSFSTVLLYPPLPIPGIISTGIIFAFTYICTPFLHCIHSPPSHWCQPCPLGRTCSILLFSDFVEEKREKMEKKNMTF